jgi:hypothetical protein
MKLRDSLAENKSIRLQAEAETWQDAVKIGVETMLSWKIFSQPGSLRSSTLSSFLPRNGATL